MKGVGSGWSRQTCQLYNNNNNNNNNHIFAAFALQIAA